MTDDLKKDLEQLHRNFNADLTSYVSELSIQFRRQLDKVLEFHAEKEGQKDE